MRGDPEAPPIHTKPVNPCIILTIVTASLHAEDVNLPRIADEVGTPFYVYSTATLERHYQVMDKAFEGTDHMICYAMKANSNQAVIKTMAAHGCGHGCGVAKANCAAPWRQVCLPARSCFPALARRRGKWRWP